MVHSKKSKNSATVQSAKGPYRTVLTTKTRKENKRVPTSGNIYITNATLFWSKNSTSSFILQYTVRYHQQDSLATNQTKMC